MVLKQRKELLRWLYPQNEFKKTFTCQLPDNSSVYTAELRAILLAHKHVYYSKEKLFWYYLIPFHLGDNNLYIKPKIWSSSLNSDFRIIYRNDKRGREIVFIWVPGHVGIRGNSAADSAAKDALDGDISVELIPFSDLKPCTNRYIY